MQKLDRFKAETVNTVAKMIIFSFQLEFITSDSPSVSSSASP